MGVETLDAKVKSLEEVIEARDEEIMKLTRRLEQITEDLDVSTRNLDQANKELAEYEKLVREAELEVSALQRQCSGKEEALDTTEERILLAQEKFAEASEAREDSDRGRKVLESRCALDAEAERADDRLTDDQSRIMELTEECKVVADNMKSLEASEAVALAKEESFEEIIRDLTQRLKDAETRASEGEKQVSTLSKDSENAEKELGTWMDKHAAIYRELETTYNEMSGY